MVKALLDSDVLPPIVLCQCEDGEIQVEDGHHRLVAHFLSGKEELEPQDYLLLQKDQWHPRCGKIDNLITRILTFATEKQMRRPKQKLEKEILEGLDDIKLNREERRKRRKEAYEQFKIDLLKASQHATTLEQASKVWKFVEEPVSKTGRGKTLPSASLGTSALPPCRNRQTSLVQNQVG
jgi:hypothetical protein